mgnify:CR=1 FL=1
MDHLLTLLRAAAEDTRLRILALAAREDLTVSDYVHVLGQSQPRVSRHLKLLVEAGLLERFRRHRKPAAYLAKRFAAKEAFSKAMGTGIRAPVNSSRSRDRAATAAAASFDRCPCRLRMRCFVLQGRRMSS